MSVKGAHFVSFLALWTLVTPSTHSSRPEITAKVERLSERVLTLTGIPLVCQVSVLATQRGIVVVDAGLTWRFGQSFRALIESELGRSDFAYVINTHCHRDHTYGNQAFSGAAIVAHTQCFEEARVPQAVWKKKIEDYSSLHQERVKNLVSSLEDLDPESPEAERTRELIAVNRRVAEDLAEGQLVVPPDLGFKERLSVDLGDMTLRLLYFGEGHTDGDILVHVPEEGLLIVGDTFSSQLLGSNISSERLDIEKQLQVLDEILATDADLKYVISGHSPTLTGEELVARRDYMRALWEGLSEARSKGLDLESASKIVVLEHFSHLTRLMNVDRTELERQHARNLERYWKQLEP